MKHPRLCVTSILHFLLSLSRAKGWDQTTYYIQKDKGLPSYSPIETLQTGSSLDCARWCESKTECYSFHAEKGNASSFTCNIYWNRFTKNEIPLGSGIFGAFFGYLEEDVTGIFNGPEYLFGSYDLDSGSHIGVYDCSKINSDMTTFAIKYDHDTETWPSLSTECEESLCHQVGLAATVLEITEVVVGGVTSYIVNTTCPRSDRHWTNAYCDDQGHWSFDDDNNLGVACVPTNCYRLNAKGKAVYGGDLEQSLNGETCIAWTSHSSNFDEFPEDDDDVSSASNFCRDPDDTGRPWCFEGDSNSDWEFCDVPLCYWPFDI